MAHRGRLNVLAHTVGKRYESLLVEFEVEKNLEALGDTALPSGGTGDVKYHLGAMGTYRTTTGKGITIRLAANPSHLEYVNPVVEGRARADQTSRKGREPVHDPSIVLPVLIHGDAAFPGQGVVSETLNLQSLDGYSTGGTVHVITNNQVGFTTNPHDSRSTRYASDPAKGFDVPIIHVNADDVEACISAAWLAFAYRERFRRDALIDLIGYRRLGHNEQDEPAYTQPQLYDLIKKHPTVRRIYADKLDRPGNRQRRRGRQDLRRRLRGDPAGAQRAQGADRRSPRRSGHGRARARPHPEPRAAHRGARRDTQGAEPRPGPRAGGLLGASKAQAAARQALGRDRGGRADRLGPCRSAGARVAPRTGSADPVHRTGHRARHLQPAAHGPPRREDRSTPYADPEPPQGNRPAGAVQLAAFGGRLPGLRVRLRGPRPGGPRHVGGAVRRLRELGPGDRRPVHRLRAVQVGHRLPPHDAPAPRLRGRRARALERQARALPVALLRGQHPHRQLHHPGPVLPSAPPPGHRRQAAPARDPHAQGPAPATGGFLPAGRPRRRPVPAGAGRPNASGQPR